MNEERAYYTVEEVARMFRVSKMSVYRLVEGGGLESVRIGKLLRIPASAVQAMRDGKREI